MNDFRKRYTKAELAEVYRQCKIVVNVSRDDFPSEANMRCYEGMAGGALLITGIPTELTEWGFREGTHFVGWRNEAEIPDLVDYYLHHENERIRDFSQRPRIDPEQFHVPVLQRQDNNGASRASGSALFAGAKLAG